jgi:hypothetical protein
MSRYSFDLTSEHSVADERIEQHRWKDEKALSPEHKCKTGRGDGNMIWKEMVNANCTPDNRSAVTPLESPHKGMISALLRGNFPIVSWLTFKC